MKRLIFTLFVLVSFAGYSQEKEATAEHESPIIYLDSGLVDLKKVYINPKNIANLNVSKETKSVYITSKEGLIFLTLDEVLDEYMGMEDNATSILYVIDDKIILDKSDILIDKSFIKSVTKVKLADAGYIDDEFGKMKVISILTSPNGDKKELRIRGLASAN